MVCGTREILFFFFKRKIEQNKFITMLNSVTEARKQNILLNFTGIIK
jgi:hypothetical protein